MNITETDLAVASALYPVLVDCARQEPARKLTYGDLLSEAQIKFPGNGAIQVAIPISLGRRLDVVRMFLEEKKLPNITSLVVNAGTGEVGSAFGANPKQIRAEVAAFDWISVSDEFGLHIADLRDQVAARKRPRISRDAAKKIMSEYAQANRGTLPKNITENRELIIELLCEGLSVEEAFQSAAMDTE